MRAACLPTAGQHLGTSSLIGLSGQAAPAARPAHNRLPAAEVSSNLASVPRDPSLRSCDTAAKALDYAERRLVVRSLSIEVSFACLLALPAGSVLFTTASRFLAYMRHQLAEDEKRLQSYLA